MVLLGTVSFEAQALPKRSLVYVNGFSEVIKILGIEAVNSTLLQVGQAVRRARRPNFQVL